MPIGRWRVPSAWAKWRPSTRTGPCDPDAAGHHLDRSRDAVERPGGRRGLEAPLPLRLGEEPDDVHAVAVVEPADSNRRSPCVTRRRTRRRRTGCRATARRTAARRRPSAARAPGQRDPCRAARHLVALVVGVGLDRGRVLAARTGGAVARHLGERCPEPILLRVVLAQAGESETSCPSRASRNCPAMGDAAMPGRNVSSTARAAASSRAAPKVEERSNIGCLSAKVREGALDMRRARSAE